MVNLFTRGEYRTYQDDDPALWEVMCDLTTVMFPPNLQPARLTVCDYCHAPVNVDRNTCAQCGAPQQPQNVAQTMRGGHSERA